MTSTNPQASMCEIVSKLRWRERRRRLLHHAVQGLLWGGVAAVIVAAAGVLLGAESWQRAWWIALWCFPAGVVVRAAVGILSPIDALRLARALDRAASGDDRFASAWQLTGHHRKERAALVLEDALARVGATSAATAVPYRRPPELKWIALPAAALALLFWFSPQPTVGAASPPEVTPEQWAAMHDDFREQLAQLPEPRSDKERELNDELERIADLLRRNPEKKDALAAIARLREEFEKRRSATGVRSASLRQAARTVQSSASLQNFASRLRQSDYNKAAEALRKLSDQLKAKSLQMTASDFEAMAQDFEQMAQEMASVDSLQHACEKCAAAAGSMNGDQLADALRRWAEELERNADKLKECDGLCRACDLLDELKRKLGRPSDCQNCGRCAKCQGNGPAAFVRRSNKKGGLKAGWGSAEKWNGGAVEDRDEQRMPALADTRERAGASTAYSVISSRENARSAQEMHEQFAEMVRKAEADLALEQAPLAYRDFLRRYFRAIRPNEEPSDDADSGRSSNASAPKRDP